jgi:hypothetical protein
MTIICDKCGHSFCRDRYVNGVLVEEYENIYGTSCPECEHFIKSSNKPRFMTERELKLELLREEMRQKMRDKIRRNTDGN